MDATPHSHATFRWENLHIWDEPDGTLHVAPKEGYRFAPTAMILTCNIWLEGPAVHDLRGGVFRIGPLVIHDEPRGDS